MVNRRKALWGKRFALTFLLCFLFMFCFSAVSFAADSSTTTTPTTSFQDSSFQNKMDQAMDEANFFERAVMKIVNGLFKLAGIAPISELIFGNPYKYWGVNNGGDLQYGLFFQSEMDKMISPLIGSFASAYITFVSLSMMFSSLKLGAKAHSPQAKADFWKDIQMWVASALFMASFWFFFRSVMDMSHAITGTIFDTMTSPKVGLSVNSVSIIASAGSDGHVFGLGDIIIFLGEWILTVMLNFIYISRKIVIIFSVLLAPFAAYSLMFARTRNFFGTWVKELLGNIFLPCIHGLIIYTFASLSSLGAGTFFKLGMLIMFIPASGIVSKWLQLGDSGSKLGGALTMAGMSGVAGAMVLGRGAMQMAGGLRRGGAGGGSAAGGSESFAGSGNDYQNGGGFGSVLDTAGRRQTAAGKMFDFAKKGAAITGGTVGALAGMVAGPGGAIVGGLLGAKAGGGLASAAGNLSTGGMGAAKAAFGSDGLLGLAKSGEWSSNLARRRETLGNFGRNLGTMFGGQMGGKVGQAAGNALSMATRRRIQTEQFGGQTSQEFAAANPGAEVYWKATDRNSAFYTMDGGQERQISAFGAGVSGLKNPVYVPYTTPSSGSTVSQGTGGTYSMSAPSQDGSVGTSRTTGLSGSTESFLRTGDAFTMDSSGQKYAFGGLDASSVKVDPYFQHSAPGIKTGTTAGQVLDKAMGTPSVAEHRKREVYTAKLGQIADEFRGATPSAASKKGAV